MMYNRYGDEYFFEKIDDNTYKVVGNLKHWRFGGNPKIDMDNLGFADPSGGPFISPGYLIEGRKVIRISVKDDNVYFIVESII